MLPYNKKNEALENLNDKCLEILNDGGINASYLVSLLSKFTNPEHTSQFKPMKDSSSNRVKDLLMNKTIPVTLYNTLMTFRNADKQVEL